MIDENLLQEKPGPMSMVRRVTTASRVCRLYVATAKPGNDLYSLAHFVVTNYGPMWFNIKLQPRCTNGSKHLLEQVKLQRLLSESIKKVTWPIVQRNAYWAHQENVLLAMLSDDDEENRKAAIDVIKKIRESPADSQVVREFRPPVIQEFSETLQDFLPSLQECKWEPPLLKHISDEELEQIADRPLELHVPCHSQGVERCIRTVTEAAAAVYGREARDGYIRAVIKSRHIIPSFESKHEFQA